VLIMMDDMGYGDIGSCGVLDARTPNLDRLARDGVRLTDAYANGAVCTPTRTALISGRYQQRVGLEWAIGATPGDQERGLPATGTSLPALLQKNGYVTGLVGKWHLGSKPEFGPNAHGFDEFSGFLGGAHDYYAHQRADGTPDIYENTTPVKTTPI
jgi:arylsulfatase A-like enzyme